MNKHGSINLDTVKRNPTLAVMGMAIAALLLLSSASTHVVAQTDAAPTAASQLAPIAPTISLGEPIRTAKLESDDPEIRYENGFFFNVFSTEENRHILIRDKDGHITGDFNLSPLENGTAPPLFDLHDVAVFKDGSIVASWIYMLPHDDHQYLLLVHYDPTGKFLEQIDMGVWTALKICAAEDNSVWTLSKNNRPGNEEVLRNYKFGSGLMRAVVPRSSFPHDNNNTYSSGHSAIDCSGDKIHALTGDGQWIEYTPGADFTITKIDEVSRSAFGGIWKLSGFAYLDNGHAYAVIHSGAGDPFKRMLAELLPSKDGKMLQWVEVPPEKTLPVNTQPPDAATPPGTAPKEPIAVTVMLGADHEDGEQLVYRTSAGEAVLWSKPLFSSSVNQRDSTPPPAASAPGAPLITTSSR